MKKIAVVLFNLGGPDSQESVKPFLFNLFNDKAIIGAPSPIRWALAKLISSKREKTAQEIYSFLGGKSPILEETDAQARALEKALNGNDAEYKCFISMRYWKPFTQDAIAEVLEYNPDEIFLLPLYPQMSTATSESSIKKWLKLADFEAPTYTIGCYPTQKNFTASYAELLAEKYNEAKEASGKEPRVLFSAHGLPEKIVKKGDPYQWQVIQGAEEIVIKAKQNGLDLSDYMVTFQSRVGPLKWIEPYTEDEIIRASKEGTPLVILPIAFVSEHSETLVELDIEYKELAEEHGCEHYYRVPTTSIHNQFIETLRKIVQDFDTKGVGWAKHPKGEITKICPKEFKRCICN